MVDKTYPPYLPSFIIQAKIPIFGWCVLYIFPVADNYKNNYNSIIIIY